MNKIVNDEPPTFPAGCGASAEMSDFVACCLKKDPAERATVSQLMEHAWMRTHCSSLTSERKREHISIFIRDLRSVFVTNRLHHIVFLCEFLLASRF
jgi:serine/threonine protein kinase